MLLYSPGASSSQLGPRLFGSRSSRPIKLFANRTADAGRWLAVDGRGPGDRRSPLGNRLRVTAGDVVQHFEVSSGGSYLSGSARPVHVGLGAASAADLTVSELGGPRRRFRHLPADHVVVLPPSPPVQPALAAAGIVLFPTP